MTLSARVPLTYALDLVYDAIDAAITDDAFEGCNIRLVKTFRPFTDMEDIADEFLVIVSPEKAMSTTEIVAFDEYMVGVNVIVITGCGSTEDVPDSKYRATLQVAQTITDEIRRRTGVHIQRSLSSMIEDELHDEMHLIGVSNTHQIKVLQAINA